MHGLSVNEEKVKALDNLRRANLKSISEIGMHLYCKVAYRTFHRWKSEDKPFKDELEEIVRQKKLELIKPIFAALMRSAKMGNFQAQKFILEKFDPDTFGEKPVEPGASEYQLIGLYGPPRPYVLNGHEVEAKLIESKPIDKNGKSGTNGTDESGEEAGTNP